MVVGGRCGGCALSLAKRPLIILVAVFPSTPPTHAPRAQEAAKGVERAVAARDEVLATLGQLRAIHAKLAALEATFEARAQEEAAKATAAAAAQA